MRSNANRLALRVRLVRRTTRDLDNDGLASEIRANVDARLIMRRYVIIASDSVIRLLYPVYDIVRLDTSLRRYVLMLASLRDEGLLSARDLDRSDLGLEVYV